MGSFPRVTTGGGVPTLSHARLSPGENPSAWRACAREAGCDGWGGLVRRDQGPGPLQDQLHRHAHVTAAVGRVSAERP